MKTIVIHIGDNDSNYLEGCDYRYSDTIPELCKITALEQELSLNQMAKPSHKYKEPE